MIRLLKSNSLRNGYMACRGFAAMPAPQTTPDILYTGVSKPLNYLNYILLKQVIYKIKT